MVYAGLFGWDIWKVRRAGGGRPPAVGVRHRRPVFTGIISKIEKRFRFWIVFIYDLFKYHSIHSCYEY
jgi:hypothetical protein